MKAYTSEYAFNQYKSKTLYPLTAIVPIKFFLIETLRGDYIEDGNEVINALLSIGELFGEKTILGDDKRNEFTLYIHPSTSIYPVRGDTMHTLMCDNRSFFLSFKTQYK